MKKINKDIFKLTYGLFSNKDKIAAAYINTTNPHYIEIDNIYYSGIIIVNYYREYDYLILKKIIDTNLNMNISIFYEKQDSYKIIRDLTYHIANVGVDLKEGNQNRQDIDIAAFTYNDAKYIRKEIQVNNEEIYYLYIYINIFSEDLKELEYLLNKTEGIMQSSGMQTRRATFREEQLFLATTPIMENNQDIKEAARRNVLTNRHYSNIPIYIIYSI